jgi:hypothetical protein
MAECVAAHMHPEDLFVAAEWGWPEYLPYLHNRMAVNIINEFARFQNKDDTIAYLREAIAEKRREGGSVYIANLRTYDQAQLRWLQQTGVTPGDLSSLGGTSSFACYNITIDRID